MQVNVCHQLENETETKTFCFVYC